MITIFKVFFYLYICYNATGTANPPPKHRLNFVFILFTLISIAKMYIILQYNAVIILFHRLFIHCYHLVTYISRAPTVVPILYYY